MMKKSMPQENENLKVGYALEAAIMQPYLLLLNTVFKIYKVREMVLL